MSEYYREHGLLAIQFSQWLQEVKKEKEYILGLSQNTPL